MLWLQGLNALATTSSRLQKSLTAMYIPTNAVTLYFIIVKTCNPFEFISEGKTESD